MPGRLVLRKSGLAALVLGLLVTVSTCLDYLWIGPIPAWLLLSVAATGAALGSRLVWRHLQLNALALGRLVVLPWLIFVLVAGVGDAANGSLADSISRLVLLDLAALFLMLTIATWSSLVSPKAVILIVALIASVQGLVAIAQFLDVQLAWTLPDLIRHISSNANALYDVMPGQFDDVGRVRGLQLFVHKFSALQGMLVVFLLTVVLSGRKSIRLSRVEHWALFATLSVAGTGLLLSFSRSVVLGMVPALIVAIAADRRLRRPVSVVPLALSVAAAAVVAFGLDVQHAAQFTRLTELSAAQNEPRLAVWAYALEAFKASPLIGSGYNVGHGVLSIAIHSVPLRILASYGLFGMLPYLGVLVGIGVILVRGILRGGAQQATLCTAALSVGTVALIDASTHSSGLLLLDVPQPALLGMFLGQAARALWAHDWSAEHYQASDTGTPRWPSSARWIPNTGRTR